MWTQDEIEFFAGRLLQDAEEMGAPEGADYVRLMRAVIAEASARIKVASAVEEA